MVVPFLFDLIITWAAGFLDAAGFTYLSGIYVSFMSGNSTGLGVAIAHERWPFALASIAAIACFVFGTFAGALLTAVGRRIATSIILLIEIGLLAISTWLVGHATDVINLLPVCVAMGMQNAVPRPVAGAAIGRSYVTGALAGVGKSLALAVSDRKYLSQAAAHASSWAALICGAIAGSASLVHLGLSTCLLIAIATLACATALDSWFRIRGTSESPRP